MINDIFKVLKETVNLDSIFRINVFKKWSLNKTLPEEKHYKNSSPADCQYKIK